MVSSSYDSASRTGRIVLRPNRSWSWRANVVFLSVITTVSLIIGTSFLLRGYWMILPFSLLEMTFLAGCLWYCVRRTHRQEVLTFTDDELQIEAGIDRPQSRHVFKRLFARFFVRRPRHPWYGPRIAVRSHGREVTIGDFLAPDDKKVLVTELQRMVDSLSEESVAR
ncbi:MAG: DUF2244 domain-containing protein [Pseudomonadales bacterium]|jgi:uncharacterized membrane protein|nr:DUF2244 domain-containing protein [Pseudomonadales bacterium]